MFTDNTSLFSMYIDSKENDFVDIKKSIHFGDNKIKHEEAIAQRCSVKKVFLKFSKNSQENTYARVSFFWWLLLNMDFLVQRKRG